MATERPQSAYFRPPGAIADMIGAPDHPPGSKTSSERALAEQFSLSRMTVFQAVEKLLRLGMLEQDSTSSTRVAEPGVVQSLAARTADSMTEMVERAEARPGTHLLRFKDLRAEGNVARRLMLPRGVPVIGIRRLRLADGVPFCIGASCLPATRVPDLAAADLMDDASLYALLRARYGLFPGQRQGRIRITAAGADDASLLRVAPGTAVPEHSSVMSDADGRPIEYVVSLNHPQFVTFTVEDAFTTVSEMPAPIVSPVARRRAAGGRRAQDGA